MSKTLREREHVVRRLATLAQQMWEVDRKSAKVMLEVLRQETGAEFLSDGDLEDIVRRFALLELRQTARDLSKNGRADSESVIEDLSRTTAGSLFSEHELRMLIRLAQVRSDGLFAVSADVLMEMEFPEPELIVPGFIAQGLTILAGKPKVGKSWLALGISLAVASGGVALGSVPVKKGRVLYLSLDDISERRIRERIGILTRIGPVPDNLHIRATWPRFDQRELGLEELEAWLIQHPDTRLIVVDTLAWVRPLRTRGGDPYAEDHAAIASIKALAEQRNVSIIVVHHLRKSESPDAVDTISGTLGLSGTADGLLMLKREGGKTDAVLHVLGRDVEEQEKALGFDAPSCCWSVLGDAEEVRRSKERQAVIRVLEKTREPLTYQEVADELGEESKSVKVKMWRMWKAGEIQKKDGKYTSG